MKHIPLILITIASALLTSASRAHAQNAAFTYQGRLSDGANSANGSYALRFALYDTPSGGVQIGSTLTNVPTVVSNGLFTVTLDFGPGVFTGAARWLEIGARTNGGGAFATLNPRQPLTPAPYSMFAGKAMMLDGLLPGSQLSGLYPNAVAFNNAGNSFSGNGAGLTGLNASQLTSGTVPLAALGNAWTTSGNAGTTPGTHFLGTTDNQPLEIKVSGLRAARLEFAGDSSDDLDALPDGAPNVILGAPVNFVAAGAVGATIAGGGATNYQGVAVTNSVLASFGAIGGGVDNRIATRAIVSTIAGGLGNAIGTNSFFSAIGGGSRNLIDGPSPGGTIAGGEDNTIEARSSVSTIGGGEANSIATNSTYGVIGGGLQNSILENSSYATIPGGRFNAATNHAFAAGNRAQAMHSGAFVWSDSQNANFGSLVTNEFAVRAGGGVRLVTGGAGVTLDGQPVLSGAVTAAQLADGAVTSVAIADGAVTSADISNGSIAAVDVNAPSFSMTFWIADGNAGTTAGTHFLGTTDNQPVEIKVNGLRALRLEFAGDSEDFGTASDGAPNVILGAPVNFVAAGVTGATISGGGATNFGGFAYTNSILASYGAIGGGLANRIAPVALWGTIAGGFLNDIGTNSDYGTIGGGNNNNIAANSPGSAIAGGFVNDIGTNSDYSAIGGGSGNGIANNAFYATIAGGFANTVGTNSNASTIGGGGNNHITNSSNSTIAGGGFNEIGTDSDFSTIGGGNDNNIAASLSTVAGGSQNSILKNAISSAIGGGAANKVAASYSTVAGGFFNDIGTNGNASTIGGGSGNIIAANTGFNTIAGGLDNDIRAGSGYSAIGGGVRNVIAFNSTSCTIAGGSVNTIGTNSNSGTISGGYNNNIASYSGFSAIGGGTNNNIAGNAPHSMISGGDSNDIGASSEGSAIGGGAGNDIGTNSVQSAIGGGVNNTIADNSSYATIPGGRNNAATNYAFSAGRRAKADHQGAFVWGDSTNADVASTNANSMTFRAAGGVRFFSNAGGGAGVFLATGGTSWSMISDRNVKKNFAPVDNRQVLERLATLPVQRWNYRWETDAAVPHLGPMAQDFKAAFYPGRDDTSITTQEMDGVALAAIQGLNQKLEAEVKSKDARIAHLERRLAGIEKLLAVTKSN